MGDIFKRLVNLAKSEISHLRDPDRELNAEFMEYFKQQPEYDKYREHFEQEYYEHTGHSYKQDHGPGKKFEDNQGYDPYKTLEVDPSASFEEIEKAYKKLVRKYHPDRYSDEVGREKATKVMSIINASFAFIKKQHGRK